MNHIQKILIRREFQEHKGGFLWAPLVAAVLFLAVSLGGMVFGSFAAHRAAASGETVMIDGQQVNTMQIGKALSTLPADKLDEVGKAVDVALVVSMAWPFLVVAFVAFFYCLSALYDERRDRSVLFWKSMPVSDNATVLSKAMSALVLAPAIATVIGAASMLVFFLAMVLTASLHGANPMVLVQHANPLSVVGGVLAVLPIYALWALPTAGWLLLCSAFAKSKPMLWAILIPVMLGVGVSMLGAGDTGWFWHHVVMRSLLGFAPGTWLADAVQGSTPFSVGSAYSLLATPALWVGAILGVGMLVAAAHVRRWKDEG